MRPLINALLFPLVIACSVAAADDWPHWMGPQRDNIWRETGILEKFPEGGPKILWRTPIAGGYAGTAVAQGRVYVTDYVTSDDVKVDNFDRKNFTGTERVLCLRESDGKELWKHEYPVTYGISYPAGPRCTPTVDEGRLYTLGAEGQLICFNAETGQVIWSKDLKTTYQTKSALWGYAAHPRIDGNKLITLAGGEGSHVVALNKLTGEEIWRSQTQTEQGYVPPSIIEAAGRRQLIVAGPDAVCGLDPETGERLWTTPYNADNGSIIMTPVHIRDYLFLGGFNNRNLLLELSQDRPGVTPVWKDKKGVAMSPVNVQPYVEDGLMYGVDGTGEMMAIEFPSGKRLWTSLAHLGGRRRVNSGTSFLVRQGDRCWMFNENGELVIAKITPDGYTEIDRAKVIEPTNNAFGREVVWCAPAFANRHLYVRNDKECIAVDLAK